MLQPNLIVHLKEGAVVNPGMNEITDINRISGNSLFDTDEIRDGTLIEQTRISTNNGGYIVDDSDIERVQRL